MQSASETKSATRLREDILEALRRCQLAADQSAEGGHRTLRRPTAPPPTTPGGDPRAGEEVADRLTRTTPETAWLAAAEESHSTATQEEAEESISHQAKEALAVRAKAATAVEQL